MLGKLFKHEMKATARMLLPLYLVLAVFTIMDRIVIYLDIFKGVLKVIPGFITFGYVVSIIALIIVSSVIIITRFYKNLMTDEGYLMFTLPVKSHELINSKLLTSTIWTITSTIAVIASIVIVFSGSIHFSEVPEVWQAIADEMKRAFGSNTTLLVIEFIVLIAVSILNSILMIYVSIAIGQLFNGHKILGSFAAYIVLNIVVQVVSTIITIIFSLIFNHTVVEINALPQVIFPISILLFTILTVVYYLVTDYIFKRKLNLD